MNRPQWSKEKVTEKVKVVFEKNKKPLPELFILGVRGYFQDSMGIVDENDRGVYDDALFVVSPSEFRSFNANTDPSRKGINPETKKGYAVLQEGLHKYKIGIHGLNKPKNLQYKALVQADVVTIKRDQSEKTETGFFGINIHRGGNTSTSSLGCQTIIPSQWNEFFELISNELKKYNQNSVFYILISDQG